MSSGDALRLSHADSGKVFAASEGGPERGGLQLGPSPTAGRLREHDLRSQRPSSVEARERLVADYPMAPEL